MVGDVEKHETGRWDTTELGEGLILSRVPWEGLVEKLIFEKRPDTGTGTIPVVLWRRNAPGYRSEGKNPEAEIEVGADLVWLRSGG